MKMEETKIPPGNFVGPQQKAKMKKKGSILIKLVSMAGTGFFYTTSKNPRLGTKLMLRKYDPVVRQHVLFKVQMN